ncbi:MAG: ASKHA domain-containing protein [Candidatus Marinimicrobia bacterium]|nr:ASKHA domain-containing protein [Candidatus Neomarinimicrobiota bacterium]
MKKINIKVHINSSVRTLVCRKGMRITEALQQHRISLPTPCGGYGTCGKCRLRFSGSAPVPSPADRNHFTGKELGDGYRLACQHKVEKNTEIFIDTSSLQTFLPVLKYGLQIKIDTDPEIETEKTEGLIYGAAVDLGTTSIVVSLIDLRNGERIGLQSARNPQSVHGTDIISRATAAAGSVNVLRDMRQAAVKKIKELLEILTKDTKNIYQIVLAGNAVMSHIFMGSSLDKLIKAPYKAAFTEMQILPATEYGLDIRPGAKITVLPAIGSFIGGDVSADLLVARRLFPADSKMLLMDIGTNCELVLQTPDGVIAASAPAGPVMEGAGIEHGMQAESGAITDIVFGGEKTFSPLTVDNKKAKGICGSGLIHIIHLLWSRGIILPEGRFAENSLFTLSKKGFRLSDGIYLSPGDIRAFQMAKAAITASWKMLFSHAGIRPEELDRFVLSGAFGHYIRPEAGMELGLFPNLNKEKFVYLGNGSLSGCEMILKNKKYSKQIQKIACTAEHIEMAGREDFQEIYAMNMGLGNDVYVR